MRSRFQRFFIGRNGLDQLAKASLILSMIFLLITSITRNPILYLITLLLLAYAYFRMMSKNVNKRLYENQKFMTVMNKIIGFFKGFKDIGWKTRAFFTEFGRKIRYGRKQDAESKAYRIYKCPECKQKVRVPRGRGKIEITCPKCRTAFIKRT